jgi:hypothetical protein
MAYRRSLLKTISVHSSIPHHKRKINERKISWLQIPASVRPEQGIEAVAEPVEGGINGLLQAPQRTVLLFCCWSSASDGRT